MKTFFLILFFGKTILLTNTPIDINTSWTEIELKKPISAITGGASLDVDVTNELGYTTDFDLMKKKIPDRTIIAELIPDKGAPLIISNCAFRYSNKEVCAILSAATEMPVKTKYKKIRIRSTRIIHGASLTWRNYKW